MLINYKFHTIIITLSELINWLIDFVVQVLQRLVVMSTEIMCCMLVLHGWVQATLSDLINHHDLNFLCMICIIILLYLIVITFTLPKYPPVCHCYKMQMLRYYNLDMITFVPSFISSYFV